MLEETTLSLADLLKVIVPIVAVVVVGWVSNLRRVDRVGTKVDTLEKAVTAVQKERVPKEVCDLRHGNEQKVIDYIRVMHTAMINSGMIVNPPEMPDDLHRVREEPKKDVR